MGFISSPPPLSETSPVYSLKTLPRGASGITVLVVHTARAYLALRGPSGGTSAGRCCVFSHEKPLTAGCPPEESPPVNCPLTQKTASPTPLWKHSQWFSSGSWCPSPFESRFYCANDKDKLRLPPLGQKLFREAHRSDAEACFMVLTHEEMVWWGLRWIDDGRLLLFSETWTLSQGCNSRTGGSGCNWVPKRTLVSTCLFLKLCRLYFLIKM